VAPPGSDHGREPPQLTVGLRFNLSANVTSASNSPAPTRDVCVATDGQSALAQRREALAKLNENLAPGPYRWTPSQLSRQLQDTSSDAGLIAQNDELYDFVVVGREVEDEHEGVREPTLVE
jgi:hypothetical protein